MSAANDKAHAFVAGLAASRDWLLGRSRASSHGRPAGADPEIGALEIQSLDADVGDAGAHGTST